MQRKHGRDTRRHGAGWPRAASVAPILVVVAAAAGACRSEGAPASGTDTARYEGAWFEVAYPASFAVRPSLESTSADGYDSAFFEAPDGSVRFYVHSPQWGGEPTDVLRDPVTEELVDSVTTQEGPVTTTRTTVAARDGAWTRSYVTRFDARGPTQWTVGWAWASQEARDRWVEAFRSFEASLEQFAN